MLQIMKAMGFHERIIKWIEVYIFSLKFFISLNCGLVSFFGSSKGLRQGDPLFPYLLAMAIEGLFNLFDEVAMHSDLSIIEIVRSLNYSFVFHK